MISNATSGNIFKVNKNTKSKRSSNKKICTVTFIATLFPIAKAWKQLKCPLMEEEVVIHTYTHTHVNIIQT